MKSFLQISGGKRKRPYDTVLPLAQDLGLDVDTECDRDDANCVANVVNNYQGNGNILIAYALTRLISIDKCLKLS